MSLELVDALRSPDHLQLIEMGDRTQQATVSLQMW